MKDRNLCRKNKLLFNFDNVDVSVEEVDPVKCIKTKLLILQAFLSKDTRYSK